MNKLITTRTLDKINDIENNSKKILFMMETIRDNYFFEYDLTNKIDISKIIYGFGQCQTATEILYTLILEQKDCIERLKEINQFE